MAQPEPLTLLGTLAIGSVAAARFLPGRRAELAFALLAAEHERLVTRDELADALWPTGLPPSWAAAVRVVIAQVRRFVREAGWEDGDALVTLRSGYQLTLPDGVETDLDRVWARTELASQHLGEGNLAGAVEAAGYVTRRAGLPFLPEHEGEWVERTRGLLRRSLARALMVEATARAALGDLGASAEAATRLVEVIPLDEVAHRLRIRLLAQSGDASGAARAFAECKAVLAAELGVEPSAETAAAGWADPPRGDRAPLSPPAMGGAPAREVEVSLPAGAPGGLADENSLRRLGVLVVEDHDFQRRTLVQVLQSIGVGWVESVADGADALERLGSLPRPDLVLCDIDMPRMDGVEFVRHLGAQGRCTAVAFTSALEPALLRSVETLSAGYGLEVLGRLPKPVTARRLRELLAGFAPNPEGPMGEAAGLLAPEDLRRSLAAGEVGAQFQPRLDLTRGTLSAAVMTPVWDRRAGGRVPPGALADVATRGGLVGAVTDELLRRAARLLNSRSAPGVPSVVIPLPRASLSDVRLADHWAEQVEAQRLDPGRVVASVDLLHSPTGPAVLDAVTRLRLKGFGLALHGFDGSLGARESSALLPLTELTIAGRLVTGAARDQHREERLEKALETARSLSLAVVADGCDDREDFALALALGCREAQGSFVGPPMSARDLGRWGAGGPCIQPHA